MEIFLVHELGKHLAVYKQVLGKSNERKRKELKTSNTLRVRHLEFLARKGEWDIFLSLVPGPLDLVEKQHLTTCRFFALLLVLTFATSCWTGRDLNVIPLRTMQC